MTEYSTAPRLTIVTESATTLRNQEQELLAAIVQYGARTLPLISSLQPGHFSDEASRLVLRTVRRIRDSLPVTGDLIDTVTKELGRYPDEAKHALSIGEALHELVKRAPAADELEHVIPQLVSAVVVADELRRASRRDEDKPKPATVVCIADINDEVIEWLWEDRIPRAMLTILDGDPGRGKSTITADLAARVTRGDLMPEEKPLLFGATRAPADVVFMTAEDPLRLVLRPRLRAAGADLHRVHAVTAIPRADDPEALPSLSPEDLAQLEAVIIEHRAALVIIDPLTAYLPDGVDTSNDREMRRILVPLGKLAERTGASIVVVRHVRKAAGSALHAGGGSLGGIIGAARSALIVGALPDDEADDATAEDEVIGIGRSKGNYSRCPPVLRARKVSVTLDNAADPTKPIQTSRIEWLGAADGITADDLVSVPRKAKRGVGESKLERAKEALLEILSDGPARSDEVITRVKRLAQCGDRVVSEARAELGVVSEPVRTTDGQRVDHYQLRLDCTPF